MEAFLISTGVVALGEIGDKTQLLALILAARFKRPLPIILGILSATLLNHTLAGAFGAWVSAHLGGDFVRWVIALSFLGVAAWALVPDKTDASSVGRLERLGVFGATAVAFFLAEMGDKTQIATAVLAARFQDLPSVIVGTTLGMMLADVPAVFVGERLSSRVPMQWIRVAAACMFAVLGIVTLTTDVHVNGVG